MSFALHDLTGGFDVVLVMRVGQAQPAVTSTNNGRAAPFHTFELLTYHTFEYLRTFAAPDRREWCRRRMAAHEEMSNASVNDEDEENEATYLVLMHFLKSCATSDLRRWRHSKALQGMHLRQHQQGATAKEALEAAQREADDAMRELALTQSLYDGIRRAARRFVRDELKNLGPSIEQLLLLCLVERRPELHHLLDRQATSARDVALALQQHPEDAAFVMQETIRRRRASAQWRPSSRQIERQHATARAHYLQEQSPQPVQIGAAPRRPGGAAAAYATLAAHGRRAASNAVSW